MPAMKRHLKRQTGAALVISLIMLLLLTLVGVTATQVTSLEEKMAGNARDANIAFQAAEAALRQGEGNIEAIVALAAFNGSAGLLGVDNPEPDYKAASTWSSSNSISYPSAIPLVKTSPRYFIKYIGEMSANDNAEINLGGYGNQVSGVSTSVFKVTARGTGGVDTTQVTLQSHYGKRF